MKRILDSGSRTDQPHAIRRVEETPQDTQSPQPPQPDAQVEDYLRRTDTTTAVKACWLLEHGLTERFIEFWRGSAKPAILVQSATVANRFADALANAKPPLLVAGEVSIELGSEFTGSAASSMVRAIDGNPHLFSTICLRFARNAPHASDFAKAILQAATCVPRFRYVPVLLAADDDLTKVAFKDHFAHVPRDLSVLCVDMHAINVAQCTLDVQRCPALPTLEALIAITRTADAGELAGLPGVLAQCKSLDRLDLTVPAIVHPWTADLIGAIATSPVQTLRCTVGAASPISIINLVAGGSGRISRLVIAHKSAPPLNLNHQLVPDMTAAILQLLSRNKLTELVFQLLIDLSAFASFGPAFRNNTRLENLVLCGGFNSPDSASADFEPVYLGLAASTHLMQIELRDRSCTLPPGWRYPTEDETDRVAAIGYRNRLRFGEERSFACGAAIGFVEEMDWPGDIGLGVARHIDNKTALALSSVTTGARRSAVDTRMRTHAVNVMSQLTHAVETGQSTPLGMEQIEAKVRKSVFEYGWQLIRAGGPAPPREWFVNMLAQGDWWPWLTQEKNALALLRALPAFRDANLGIGDIGRWFLAMTKACDWQEWASTPEQTTLLQLLQAVPQLSEAKLDFAGIRDWLFERVMQEGSDGRLNAPAVRQALLRALPLLDLPVGEVVHTLVAAGLDDQAQANFLLNREIWHDRWSSPDVFNAMEGPDALDDARAAYPELLIGHLMDCQINSGLSFYVAFNIVIPGREADTLKRDLQELIEKMN